MDLFSPQNLFKLASGIRRDHWVGYEGNKGNSIKDPGMAGTGIGFLVLLLYENTLPGHGPFLAETVRNGSREQFLGLVWEFLGGTGHYYFALNCALNFIKRNTPFK